MALRAQLKNPGFMWFQSSCWCDFSSQNPGAEIKVDRSTFSILLHVLERIHLGEGRKDSEGLNNESKTLERIEKELNTGRDCRENKELRAC